MNARWILSVALACCGAYFADPDAIAQAQYGQPTSQFGAQQTPAYSASTTPAYQNAASTAPSLPPTQTNPLGTTFYNPQAPAQPARSSVFSTQPTANPNTQGWTGANDPRYTASVANDPRYAAAPQLSPPVSPPEAAAAQQYANQLNAAASQFNNTLRDGQQQAQQLGQTAQQYGQWDPLESTCRHASLSIL